MTTEWTDYPRNVDKFTSVRISRSSKPEHNFTRSSYGTRAEICIVYPIEEWTADFGLDVVIPRYAVGRRTKITEDWIGQRRATQ